MSTFGQYFVKLLPLDDLFLEFPLVLQNKSFGQFFFFQVNAWRIFLGLFEVNLEEFVSLLFDLYL